MTLGKRLISIFLAAVIGIIYALGANVLPAAANTNNLLYGVTCASATDCWAVGNNSPYQTLIEQNTGGAWTQVSSPSPGSGQNLLYSVTCVSTADCWAVGYYQNVSGPLQTLIEQNTGSGWAIVSSPNSGTSDNQLRSMTCVGANDCWAVGGAGGQTLIEQYNGTGWSIVSSPNPSSSDFLTSVTCAGANDCWAVGDYYDSVRTANDTLTEQNTGSGWIIVSSPNQTSGDNLLSGVACTSASDCFAVGYTGNGLSTLIEENTGTGWVVDNSPNIPGASNQLNGVTCVSGGCWAVGYEQDNTGTHPFIVQGAGSSWAAVTSPSPGSANNNLYAVACANANDCWAVGALNNGTGLLVLIEQNTGSGWFWGQQQPPVGGAVMPQELRGGKNCACANGDLAQSYSAEPVDTAYGNFTETYTDVSIPGRGFPLKFTRTYNALTAGSNGPLGYGWTFNAIMSLSQPGGTGPVTITQEAGAQVVFNQTGSTYTPAAPRVTATLSQSGGIWTFVRRARDTYTFSAAGQLLTERDLNGYTTSFGYNGSNQLTTITDPAGRTISIGWTGTTITSVTDPNVSPNRTATFQYNDGNGNLTDVIDVNGGHSHFTYDPNHHLTNLFDPNCYAAGAACNGGNGVLNGYDGQGRVTSQQDQLGRQTTFVYLGDPSSATAATTTITDPKGNVTVDTYQYGLLIQQTKGYGSSTPASWQYTYDPSTVALVSQTDPNGHTTTYSVDGSGNRLSKIDALGRQTAATYNSFNEPLTQTDGLNVATTDTYDANGNLTSVSRPLLDSGGHVIATRTTQYNHTDAMHPGDVTSIVDADSKTWNYGYDTYGDPTSATDPLGNKATATFNADSWLLTSVSPRGNVTGCNCASQYTTTRGYVDTITGRTNEFGDVATITDPLGHITTNHYDANRNLTSTLDANNNTTSNTFDLANQQTLVTRADHTTLQTDYNLDGTMLDQKDGKGNPIVRYAYDALARVSSQTDALGNVTMFTYDSAGNRQTQQDPGGNCNGAPATGCTTMFYDAGNELTSLSYSDGVTPNVSSISYDSDGQRVGMTDGSGSSVWAWDSLHRVTSFTDGNNDQVQYQYNLRGLATQITYPGSLSVIRGYDNAGRWTSTQDWLNNTTNFGYDPDGNFTTKTLPAATGIVDTSVFNAASQLSSMSDVKGVSTTVFSATYGRDTAGQVNSDSSLPAAVASDKYTQLNQLCYAGSSNTSSCSTPPTGSQAYSFDAADNLTGVKGNTQAFSAADTLCWAVSGSSSNTCGSVPTGATQYTYNTRGDRTGVTPASGNATSLSYDQANRLTRWIQGSTTATYAYNGDGLRMKKTVAGVTSAFTWDVSGQSTLLIGDGTSSYVYGPGGQPIEQITTRPAISLVGTATGGGKASSLKLTFPAGTKANDQVFVASTQPSTTTVTAPSGYTTVTSVTSGGTSPKATTVVFRHAVVTGDTSVTLTYSTSTTAQAAVLAAYRGIDPSLPVDVSATGSAAASTAVTVPSATTTYAGDELFVVHGGVGTFSASSWTAPSGMTERAQVNTTANVSTGIADQALGAAGATGTRTSTFGRTANLTSAIIAVPRPPTVLFYHPDQLSSTRLLTDAVGAVRGTFTYDPYGNQTSSTGAYSTPLGFSGQYQDAESGLIYLRARYYDPATAQLLTRDPMVAMTRSPYGYVGGNPLNASDPSGLDFCSLADDPNGPRCRPGPSTDPNGVPLGAVQCNGDPSKPDTLCYKSELIPRQWILTKSDTGSPVQAVSADELLSRGDAGLNNAGQGSSAGAAVFGLGGCLVPGIGCYLGAGFGTVGGLIGGFVHGFCTGTKVELPPGWDAAGDAPNNINEHPH